MIRPTIGTDASALISILQNSGQFDEAALEQVRARLNAYLEGGSDALWYTADEGGPIGVAYCASEPVTNGTWNLLLLWTRSDHSHRGVGTALVQEIERELRDRRVRLLVVDTSGLPEFEAARAFYKKCGFSEEARIRNFFADGDDKIVLAKTLLAAR